MPWPSRPPPSGFAAFRTVLDNRGVSEGERRGAVVVSAAAEPVAAVICLAAAGVIVGQGAAGDVSLVEKRAAMAPSQPSPPLCPSSPSAQPWDRQGQGCNAAGQCVRRRLNWPLSRPPTCPSPSKSKNQRNPASPALFWKLERNRSRSTS